MNLDVLVSRSSFVKWLQTALATLHGMPVAGRKGATRAGQMFKKTAAKRVVAE